MNNIAYTPIRELGFTSLTPRDINALTCQGIVTYTQLSTLLEHSKRVKRLS